MQKLHFSIVINAPKEKVWHTMLDDTTYREWTAAFNPGSHYKGIGIKGQRYSFLGRILKPVKRAAWSAGLRKINPMSLFR